MNIPHYFDNVLSRGYYSLYVSRFIVNISNGLFGIFIPIYIFTTLQENFTLTAFFYVITSFFYMLLLPFGAQVLNHYGMRKSMWFAIIFGSMFFVLLAIAPEIEAFVMITAAAATLVIFRLLYWVPYHTSFAVFSSLADRTRQVSFMYATMNLTGTITPLIAGFIITTASYSVLFFVGILIYILAIIPLIYMPPVNEHFTWSIHKTWTMLFAQKNRSTLTAFFASGVETAVGILVWPLFIFLLLDGDYFSIGALASLITAASVFLELLIGRYSDHLSKKYFIRYGSIFYALGWIFKIFIITASHIFIIDAYHRIIKIFTRAPFEALTYDIAADQGHYIDEFTVIKEMAHHTGRTTAYMLIILIVLIFPLQWAFLIAALATLFINMIRTEKCH